MRMRLQIALMAPGVAAFFLSLPTPAVCGEPASHPTTITATTDGAGRKVYVNDEGSPNVSSNSTAPAAGHSGLVYWSSSEHRWKPAPLSGAAIRAARSAASEVNNYLDSSSQFHLTPDRVFTPQEVD